MAFPKGTASSANKLNANKSNFAIQRLPLPCWLLAMGVVLFTACSERDVRNIQAYYFPLAELTEGMVYEYRSVGADSLAPDYWYYRSMSGPQGAFLVGNYYGPDLKPQQLVREELVSNGMLLADLILYETDSTGRQRPVKTEVLSGSVFPFEVRDSGGVFLYKIRWNPPSDPGAEITLIKNRYFAGDTTVNYRGEAYDAVVFTLRELIAYDREGVLEKQYEGREVYAKGLGLFYYRKDISEELSLRYELADRYSMEQLEEKFEEFYGIEARKADRE